VPEKSEKRSSINDFDLNDHKRSKHIPAKMNSPRTIEALRILGLEPEELVPISMNDIKQYFI
jgi:hypothetical protein